jgi:hypothetical protein
MSVLYVRPIYGFVSSGVVVWGIWHWRKHRPSTMSHDGFIEKVDPDNMEIVV